MKKEIKQNFSSLDVHEVLDRSAAITTRLEHMLIQHPFIRSNKRLRKKLKKAQSIIYNVYETICGMDEQKFIDKK